MQTTDYEAMLQGTNNSQLGFHHGIKTTLPGEKLAGYGSPIRNPLSALAAVTLATGLFYNAYSNDAGKKEYALITLAMIGGLAISHSIN